MEGPFSVVVTNPETEIIEAVIMTAGGPPGPAGEAATVSIGTTTTGVAGSNANVVNIGTSTSAVLNFEIPRGATGSTGAGVPTGGTVGQTIAKIDSTDFNTQWLSIPSADTVSARLVSVSAELGSLIASGDNFLSARITSAEAAAGTSVTSAKVATASAAATSADAHANAVSARAVSISAELASMIGIASAAATSADTHAATASAAATSANAHANTVSIRLVSASAELGSLIASGDAFLSARITSAESAAGSGNVTAGGTLTSNSVVLGAGTTAVKVVSGIFTDGTAQLTLGQTLTSTGSLVFGLVGGGTTTLSPQNSTLTNILTIPPVSGGGTDTLVGKATTDILTNKTLTTPHISSGTNLVFDCPSGFTLSLAATNSGANRVYTLPNTPDDTFVFLANVGTLTNKTLTTPHISSGTNVVFDTPGGGTIAISAATTAATRVFTLPNAADDTFVFLAATQTLTNKSIDAGQLTGTVATARLGSGTATSTTFLRGDQTWVAPPSADTVSARLVSVSAELASLIASGDAFLSARITSAEAITPTTSVTSAKVATASAAATSADAHANTVSARAVSISAELASLIASGDAFLSARITSAEALIGGGASMTSAEVLSVVQGYSTIATAAGTTSISVNSPPDFFLTGSTTQTFQLPVVSTLVLGRQFMVKNDSSGVVTVQSSGANTIVAMAAGSTAVFTCIAITGTGTASWSYSYSNAAVDTLSARVVSVSAELVSLFTSVDNKLSASIQTASAAATSADAHANTVSARVVSVSAELASLVQIASAAATSADTHANTVSARAVSISNELGSLLASTSTALQSAINTVSAGINTVSARAVSISNELGSLLASTSTALQSAINTVSAGVNTVSARLVSASAELMSDIQGYSTIATAAGTTAVVAGTPPELFFTGSTTQTVTLPDVTTLVLGKQYLVKNNSSGVVTVQSSGANTIVAMAANTAAVFTCIAITGTGTASWDYTYSNTASDIVSARAVSISAEVVSLLTSATARRAVNTANQAVTSASTGVTVSGVSIPLISSQVYRFHFMIPFTTTLLNGIMVAVVGPATNTYYAKYRIPGAVGNAGLAPAANAVTPFDAEVRAIGTIVSTTSITLTGTTLVAEAWGTINASANGSIKFVIGPNTSGSTPLTPLRGANVLVWRIA